MFMRTFRVMATKNIVQTTPPIHSSNIHDTGDVYTYTLRTLLQMLLVMKDWVCYKILFSANVNFSCFLLIALRSTPYTSIQNAMLKMLLVCSQTLYKLFTNWYFEEVTADITEQNFQFRENNFEFPFSIQDISMLVSKIDISFFVELRRNGNFTRNKFN